MEIENEKTIKRRAMRDKIRMAIRDERNGTKFAIYQRIRRTGSPFKTIDKRCKYGTDPVTPKCEGLSRQTVFHRIRRMGWTVEKATTTPPMKVRGRKNGQNNRKTIPNSILAQ